LSSIPGGSTLVRFLFLNRSYYPDVEATGQLLSELCADLATSHEVAVIAGRPNFVIGTEVRGLIGKESHEGVEIVRVRNFRFKKVKLLGRIAGLLSYVLLAFWAALRQRRPDAIVVETDPPILGAMGAFLKWWHRCPLVFYLQDLFPEVGLITGRLRPGLMATFLRWMTQIGLRHADRVVVLGEDMRRRVLQRGVDPAKVAIVPNWADAEALRTDVLPNRLRKEWQVEQFLVAYSGNIGLSQNLDQVLVAAELLRGEAVQFFFVGEGAAKDRLMAMANERQLDNVRFLPYQPKQRLGESLAAADVHLIPLQRGLAGYIVPSKLYGILAVGRPYIAAVEEDSEVATITLTERTGLRVEPDSPQELADAVRWCLTHRAELAEMGRRGRALAESRFDRRHSVAAFDRLLRDLKPATLASVHLGVAPHHAPASAKS
jgi:glycosyltransferase involved in cell wall biosynthesis